MLLVITHNHNHFPFQVAGHSDVFLDISCHYEETNTDDRNYCGKGDDEEDTIEWSNWGKTNDFYSPFLSYSEYRLPGNIYRFLYLASSWVTSSPLNT